MNRYWRHNRGRFHISTEGKRFRQETQDAVYAACVPRQLKGRLRITADLYPPDRRRRDIDNVLKALLDAIQHSGLIDDDNQFDRLEIVRQPSLGGFADVFIEELDQ